MTPTFRKLSGRPKSSEYAAYAHSDIAAVEGSDAVAILQDQRRQVLTLMRPLDETTIQGVTYSTGKWTLKEVLGHLIDDERIYSYRALCIARGDKRPLPGFDEKEYMADAGFEARLLTDLMQEYRAVRDSSIALFRGLPENAWLRRGTANSISYTVRGLAFHIAGHELHHLRLIKEKYLPASHGK
jgi:hypothetical protein